MVVPNNSRPRRRCGTGCAGGSGVAGRLIIGNASTMRLLCCCMALLAALTTDSSAATRAYVMNGLFVGHGLAVIADRLRQRGYIVAYGSYEQNRAIRGRRLRAHRRPHRCHRPLVWRRTRRRGRDAGRGLRRPRRDHDRHRSVGVHSGQRRRPCGEFRRRASAAPLPARRISRCPATATWASWKVPTCRRASCRKRSDFTSPSWPDLIPALISLFSVASTCDHRALWRITWMHELGGTPDGAGPSAPRFPATVECAIKDNGLRSEGLPRGIFLSVIADCSSALARAAREASLPQSQERIAA